MVEAKQGREVVLEVSVVLLQLVLVLLLVAGDQLPVLLERVLAPGTVSDLGRGHRDCSIHI